MKWILSGLLVAVVFLVLRVLFYVGAFKPIEITVLVHEPIQILAKDHSGAYHKIVPVIQDVESWAKSNGNECRLTFGQFFDNPRIMDETRLRSRGGCVVSKKPEIIPSDFEWAEIPSQKYVSARFEGSPGIGPLKVYPKVEDFIEENRLQMNGPVIEIYEVMPENEMKTQYLFPIKDTP